MYRSILGVHFLSAFPSTLGDPTPMAFPMLKSCHRYGYPSAGKVEHAQEHGFLLPSLVADAVDPVVGWKKDRCMTAAIIPIYHRTWFASHMQLIICKCARSNSYDPTLLRGKQAKPIIRSNNAAMLQFLRKKTLHWYPIVSPSALSQASPVDRSGFALKGDHDNSSNGSSKANMREITSNDSP